MHRVLRPRALQLMQRAKIAISTREKPRNLEGELSAAFRRCWWRWPPGERGPKRLSDGTPEDRCDRYKLHRFLMSWLVMRGASSRTPGTALMTSPCEGFPFAASDTMMLRLLGSQSNPERYQIYFRDRGADLLIKTSIGPKIGRGSSSSRHQRPRSAIGGSPVDFSKSPPKLS
jgi:hypothetical protein